MLPLKLENWSNKSKISK